MNAQIKSPLTNKSYISVDVLTPKLVSDIFAQADKLREMSFDNTSKILKGKLVTLLFFEPSSRTFSSFAAAVKKLGGMTIEYQNPLQTSSATKGETMEDTMCVFENYSDAIIMRHFQKGTLKLAAEAVSVPVINAGDGIGEHPSQALLDTYTIHRNSKKLSELTGVIVGDLVNGRTVHSLLKLLSLYKNNTVYLLSPKQLKIEKKFKEEVENKGLRIIEISSQKEIPVTADFWYWTRVQKERFTNRAEYEKLKHSFILTQKLLEEKGNKKMIILHPLPRVGEIEEVIDADPRAVYLTEQIQNGLYIRMALLSIILG